MPEISDNPARTPRKRTQPLPPPAKRPEGLRHPEHPGLVWRGNNWVVEGRGKPFSIVEEIEEARLDR